MRCGNIKGLNENKLKELEKLSEMNLADLARCMTRERQGQTALPFSAEYLYIEVSV